MDTWLIAQCMARLPRLTYFSHPESSLDDFFSGETSIMVDGSHRGDSVAASSRQGPAPHELQFLRSLSQSLGIGPRTTDDRAAGPDLSRYHGRVPSRGHSSRLADRQPCATSRERTAGPPLRPSGGHSFFADTSMPTSSPDPFSVSILPFLSTPSNMKVPAMASSTRHATSRQGLKRPIDKSAQLPVVTNAFHTSSRYQCNWETANNRPCGKWIEGGSREVWVHVRTAHDLKGRYGGWCQCKWNGCLEKLKVSSLQRHLAKHLDIKWRCSSCEVVFSRYDTVRRHIKLNEECHGAEATPHLVSEQMPGASMRQAADNVAENSMTNGLALAGEYQGPRLVSGEGKAQFDLVMADTSWQECLTSLDTET